MLDEISGGTDAATAAVGDGFLLRFRALALLTATLLVVLVFVGLPLQLAAGRPGMANVVGTIHGFCYVAYLVAAFQLTRRLGVPRWQMALVLLAGTLPLCGFVAERKMTRRFAAAATGRPVAPKADRSPAARRAEARERWLSRRALLLHAEVAVVAPACAVAGWWQATRALAGNGLSWFYSVEWPIFSLIALWGWWYLVHEDPEVFRARKEGRAPGFQGFTTAAPGGTRRLTVTETTARTATVLAVLVGLELATGVAAVVLVPFARVSGFSPARGIAVYVVHGVLGGPLAVGAAALLARTRGGAGRLARMSGTLGAVGVALAGLGGLLTGAHALRLAGMGCMLLGTIIAGFGFVLPSLERLERREAADAAEAAPATDG